MRQPSDNAMLVRLARPDDEPAILALINVVQPHAPWTKEHFDWQFHHTPLAKPVLRVVEIEGRVAAFLAVSMRKVTVLDEIYDGFLLQDGMTHPDFRGRGVFHHIAAALKESQAKDEFVGLLFPNKTSENTFRRNGFTPVMKYPLCVAQTSARETSRPSSLREVSSFGAEAFDVWNAAGMKVGVVRDAVLLNWRYGIPNTTYSKVLIDDGAGFAVLKVYNRGGTNVINVCELVVRNQERQSLSRALEDIHAFAARNNAPEIQAFLPQGHPYASAFETAGFRRDAAMDRYFITDGPQKILPVLATEASWHLSQGDNDVY